MMATGSETARPRVTVAVPTWNRPDGLVRAVESVLSQDYPWLEVLISDNGSTDETPEVCRRLAEADGRICWFRQERNLGPIPNFSFLLSQASGSYFMWVADDDTLEPDVLGKYVSFLDHHPDYVLISGIVRYWDRDTLYKTEEEFDFEQENNRERVAAFYRKVSAGGIFHGLMRRTVACEVGLRNVLGSDWCFIAGLLLRGKAKQFSFPGYNKYLIGLSCDMERYAAAVHATRLERCLPPLAIAWQCAFRLVTDRRAYGLLPLPSRLVLALRAGPAVAWRMCVQPILREPRVQLFRTLRMVARGSTPPGLRTRAKTGLRRFRRRKREHGSKYGV